MNHHEHRDESRKPDGFQRRLLSLVDEACSRMGASRRQFGILALLLVVACTFWARPAGMLIWHRLRIVTGMPRMAVANEDPDVLAQVDFDPPELIDAGRKVELDDTLVRDPFLADESSGDGGEVVAGNEGSDTGLDPDDHIQLLTGLTAQIRLSGTCHQLAQKHVCSLCAVGRRAAKQASTCCCSAWVDATQIQADNRGCRATEECVCNTLG